MNKTLIALLAGVAIGILVAPDKGSATRNKLIDGFNDVADELEAFRDRFSTDEKEWMDEAVDLPSGMGSRV
ncbi:MAG: YtxH domain-containing protein [Chitinophagaceae bacterium]